MRIYKNLQNLQEKTSKNLKMSSKKNKIYRYTRDATISTFGKNMHTMFVSYINIYYNPNVTLISHYLVKKKHPSYHRNNLFCIDLPAIIDPI